MPGDLRNHVGFRLRAWSSTRELTSPRESEPSVSAARPRRCHGGGVRALAGYGCVAVAVLLVVAGAAFGASPHGATAALHDVAAWLANDRPGSVTQVNGLSGRADARVQLTGTAGHRLKVIQDGSTILIEDTTTHTITRIDPTQLAAAQTAVLGTAGSQIVMGAGLAYLVDPQAAIVQQIDPLRLTTIGRPVGPPALKAPLGTGSAITADGTLWVPDDAAGALVPVRHGVTGRPVPVGRRGDTLSLTVANGHPAVVDSSAATMTVLASAQRPATVGLPPTGGRSVLVPPSTGTTVPLLVGASHELVLVNTASGTVSSVALAGLASQQVDAPQILGPRVYIPDQTQGTLLSYDISTGAQGEPIEIGSQPGQQIDAFVQDGVLWANVPDGSQAVAVNADGTSYPINKYQTQLPGGPLPALSHAPGPSPSQGAGPAPSQGAGPGPSQGPAGPPAPPASPSPSPQPRPTPAPPPTAPANVIETPQAGDILVTFNPVATGTPVGYQLTGAPQAASVTPGQVAPGGPFRFTVSGLSCGQTYPFAVTAVFPNGKATSSPAAPAQPCTAPGTPGALNATPVNQGINLAWQAAAANGGTVSYTVAWSGAVSGSQPGVTGTTFQITGLANQNSYTVTVTAVNEVGPGPSLATTTASLTLPPPVGYNIYNNSGLPVNMRSAPNTGAPILTQFPPTPAGGRGTPVTVQCQELGDFAQDPADKTMQSHIWDFLTGNGHTGWVSDLYVSTPSSVAGNYSSFSDPPLWNC
jgi:hypothetical protein